MADLLRAARSQQDYLDAVKARRAAVRRARAEGATYRQIADAMALSVAFVHHLDNTHQETT